MAEQVEDNQISLNILLFRVVVFVAVLIGIVQFFNILYLGVHDVPHAKKISHNTNESIEATIVSTDSTKPERFIKPKIELVKPEPLYENKEMVDKQMIKPEK